VLTEAMILQNFVLGGEHVEHRRCPPVVDAGQRDRRLDTGAGLYRQPDVGKPAPLFTAVDSNGGAGRWPS
jgi:hypothetical protein